MRLVRLTHVSNLYNDLSHVSNVSCSHSVNLESPGYLTWSWSDVSKFAEFATSLTFAGSLLISSSFDCGKYSKALKYNYLVKHKMFNLFFSFQTWKIIGHRLLKLNYRTIFLYFYKNSCTINVIMNIILAVNINNDGLRITNPWTFVLACLFFAYGKSLIIMTIIYRTTLHDFQIKISNVTVKGVSEV